jgi:single-stranded-DNA-specific exonuclease
MTQTQTKTSTQTNPQQNLSIPSVILKILYKRGYTNETIKDFFSWNLSELPKLNELKDIDRAAKRIIKAIEQNEKIGIYGDYDVDGTTSCALLYHFFKMIGVDVLLFQPSRFVEGYGLHISSIEQAIENNIKVFITVDCGISSIEACDYAVGRNLDLIITDHHKDATPEMAKAFAIINPNRRDEDPNSQLTALAGVGVAFALCLQIKTELELQGKKIESIYPLLQFVAIGTISDLAKLTPMNLKLVRHGLKQIPSSQYAGILAFFTPEERQVPFIPSEKISFNIGPLINSKGRLDHPEKALNLLTSENREDALLNYSHLEISNRERKYIQSQVFEEAKKDVISQIKHNKCPIAITYNPEWHEGVIGIVASKLVENFGIPAMVFTNSEKAGLVKASARSAGELNLFEALKQCESLFEKFGGHKSAAGLSMKAENLPKLREELNQILLKIPEIQRTRQNFFDVDISFEEINLTLVRAIDMLEPFGMENARPIFRLGDFVIESFKILKDAHVKWTLVSKKNPSARLFGISFNYINKWGELDPAELFEIQNTTELKAYCSVGLNRFNGNEFIQLMIERISVGELA